jgi:hypothetical protein
MDQRPLDLDPRSATRKVRVARVYSNIISPPVVSAAMGFSIAWVDWPFWQGLVWAAAYGVMTSLLPMGVVLYMLKKGRISDLHISNRRERHIPYLAGIICSVVAVVIVNKFGDDLPRTCVRHRRELCPPPSGRYDLHGAVVAEASYGGPVDRRYACRRCTYPRSCQFGIHQLESTLVWPARTGSWNIMLSARF